MATPSFSELLEQAKALGTLAGESSRPTLGTQVSGLFSDVLKGLLFTKPEERETYTSYLSPTGEIEQYDKPVTRGLYGYERLFGKKEYMPTEGTLPLKRGEAGEYQTKRFLEREKYGNRDKLIQDSLDQKFNLDQKLLSFRNTLNSGVKLDPLKVENEITAIQRDLVTLIGIGGRDDPKFSDIIYEYEYRLAQFNKIREEAYRQSNIKIPPTEKKQPNLLRERAIKALEKKNIFDPTEDEIERVIKVLSSR